jgi:hypothetical protein
MNTINKSKILFIIFLLLISGFCVSGIDLTDIEYIDYDEKLNANNISTKRIALTSCTHFGAGGFGENNNEYKM